MLWVAVPCCSTAEEIEVVISLMRSIVSPIALIASTDSPVARCMLTIWELISSVAFAVWPARFLTSCATTANPRPASPARAASMVALSASRLVCSAIDVISFTTSPIRSPAADNSAIRSIGCVGLLDRIGGDTVGILNPAADFDDRLRQFVRSGRGTADMFRGLSGGTGGLTRHLRRRMRRHGKLLGILFELPGRIQHLLDDSADLGAEILDKLIELRFAPFDRQLFGTHAFGLELATLDAVVLENVDGPRDRADFVVAIGVLNFDVRPSLGEDGQRFRHGLQRLGDAANNHHRQPEREQRGDGGGDGHCADRLPQHAVEFGRRNADIDDADDFAGRTENRLIRRVETTAEQHRRAFVGLAAAKHGLRGMIRRELRADRPVAIFFFHIGGSANKLL